MILSYNLVRGLTLRPPAQAGHAPRPCPLGHQLILVPHPPDGGLRDLVTKLRVNACPICCLKSYLNQAIQVSRIRREKYY